MNSIAKQRKQGENTTEKLRSKARKQVFKYIKHKFSGNRLAFIAGDVFGKVQEPYRLWAEQGNQLETDQDYRRFIKYVGTLVKTVR